jgi:hypothetical protein
MTSRRIAWLLVLLLLGCGTVAGVACGTSQTTGANGSGLPTDNTSEGGGSAAGGSAASGQAGATTGSGGGTGLGTGASGATSGNVANGGSGSTDTDDAGASAPTGGDDAGPTTPVTPHMGNTCLKAGSGDYSKAGPYTVSTLEVDLASLGELPDAGPTTYKIFYPQPFETNCLHPIVAWGNGTAVTGSAVYAFYNNNAASWGVVVAASDNPDTGSGLYHKAGIDYLLKQNEDSTSPFYHKLSTRAGVSGHSQGGLGATVGANLIGANCEAEVCVAGGGLAPKTTAFICLTGSKDLAEASCTAGYQEAPGQAFLADWDGGDHVTTETLAGYITGNPGSIQMMRLYAAWFRCFLADDQVACKLFEGGAPKNCGMCKDPGWHVLASKGL